MYKTDQRPYPQESSIPVGSQTVNTMSKQVMYIVHPKVVTVMGNRGSRKGEQRTLGLLQVSYSVCRVDLEV